jgi:hypothetical protein
MIAPKITAAPTAIPAIAPGANPLLVLLEPALVFPAPSFPGSPSLPREVLVGVEVTAVGKIARVDAVDDTRPPGFMASSNSQQSSKIRKPVGGDTPDGVSAEGLVPLAVAVGTDMLPAVHSSKIVAAKGS